MGDRSVRNRLDFLDLEDAQVGEPALKSKQRIVVGTGVLGQALAGPRGSTLQRLSLVCAMNVSQEGP